MRSPRSRWPAPRPSRRPRPGTVYVSSRCLRESRGKRFPAERTIEKLQCKDLVSGRCRPGRRFFRVDALAYDLTGPPDAPVLVLGGSLGTTRAMWQPQLDA